MPSLIVVSFSCPQLFMPVVASLPTERRGDDPLLRVRRAAKSRPASSPSRMSHSSRRVVPQTNAAAAWLPPLRTAGSSADALNAPSEPWSQPDGGVRFPDIISRVMDSAYEQAIIDSVFGCADSMGELVTPPQGQAVRSSPPPQPPSFDELEMAPARPDIAEVMQVPLRRLNNSDVQEAPVPKAGAASGQPPSTRRPSLERMLDALVEPEEKAKEPERLAHGAGQLKIAKALNASLSRVVDMFRKFDRYGGGEVDREEFRHAIMTSVLHEQRTFDETDLDRLFDEFDHDGDGRISYQEFQRTLKKWNKGSTASEPKLLPAARAKLPAETEAKKKATPGAEAAASDKALPTHQVSATDSRPRTTLATMPMACASTRSARPYPPRASLLFCRVAKAAAALTPRRAHPSRCVSFLRQAEAKAEAGVPRVSSAPRLRVRSAPRRPSAFLPPPEPPPMVPLYSSVVNESPQPKMDCIGEVAKKAVSPTALSDSEKPTSRWSLIKAQVVKPQKPNMQAALQEVAFHALKRREVLVLLADFKSQHAEGVCKVKSFKQLLRLQYPTATKEELGRWLEWVSMVEAAEAEAAALAEARARDIRAIFDALDTDGGGTIGMSEFMQLQVTEPTRPRLRHVAAPTRCHRPSSLPLSITPVTSGGRHQRASRPSVSESSSRSATPMARTASTTTSSSHLSTSTDFSITPRRSLRAVKRQRSGTRWSSERSR